MESNKVKKAFQHVCNLAAGISNIFSGWTTAVGLNGFLFHFMPVSLIFSFLVQTGLLVSSYLIPSVLFEKAQKGKERLRKAMEVLVLLVFYCLFLCVSSGFNYIFIANRIYGPTVWQDTVNQAVEQEYRNQIFESQDFVTRYLHDTGNRLNAAIGSVSLQLEEDIRNAKAEAASVPQDLEGPVQALKTTHGVDLSQDSYWQYLSKNAVRVQQAAADQDTNTLKQIDETLAKQQEKLAEKVQALSKTHQEQQASWAALQDKRAKAWRKSDIKLIDQELAQVKADSSRTKQELDAYTELQSAYENVAAAITIARSQKTVAVEDAIFNFQSELLQPSPSVEKMQDCVSVMAEYIQARQQDGAGHGLTGQFEAVRVLNETVEQYSCLNQLDNTLKQETEDLVHANKVLNEKLAEEKQQAADEGREADTMSVVQSFWRSKVENLRNALVVLPVYTGEDPVLQQDHRAKACENLGKVIHIYLTKNTLLRNAYNFIFKLSAEHRMEAIFVIPLSLLVDILPLLMHAARRRSEKRNQAEKG